MIQDLRARVTVCLSLAVTFAGSAAAQNWTPYPLNGFPSYSTDAVELQFWITPFEFGSVSTLSPAYSGISARVGSVTGDQDQGADNPPPPWTDPFKNLGYFNRNGAYSYPDVWVDPGFFIHDWLTWNHKSETEAWYRGDMHRTRYLEDYQVQAPFQHRVVDEWPGPGGYGGGGGG